MAARITNSAIVFKINRRLCLAMLSVNFFIEIRATEINTIAISIMVLCSTSQYRAVASFIEDPLNITTELTKKSMKPIKSWVCVSMNNQRLYLSSILVYSFLFIQPISDRTTTIIKNNSTKYRMVE